MKASVLAYILCLWTVLSAAAQVDVVGKVLDKGSGEPMQRASVVIKGKDGKLKKFTTTDSKGAFAMHLPSAAGCRMEVSVMGYARQLLPLDSVEFPLIVFMEQGATLLQEVTVKGNSIREQGDTITYTVNAFSQTEDRSIGDVMKRMPGIDVEQGGTIKYQGKEINKFYIEGRDLLGAGYGIATEGVRHDDVGAVEVMEDHQPLLVLGGIAYSDQAAINLKLKEKAKAKWNVNGSAGGGYCTMPEGGVWQGSLFAMMAKSDFQHITDFRTNNTGHTLGGIVNIASNTGLTENITVPVPSPYSIGGRSMLFNRSAQISTNTLCKLGSGELKGKLGYSFNRTAGMASSATTYFLEGGDRIITEERQGVNHGHELGGSFTYEQNQRSAYINNTLGARLDWRDATLDVTGTLPNSESGLFRNGLIANDFKMIKRFRGKNLVTFVSKNEWQKLPQSVTIDRDGELARQSMNESAFYTEESAAYSFTVKGITIDVEGGVTGYLRSMNSRASGVEMQQVLGGDSLVNAINTNYVKLFLQPRLEYRLHRVNFILNAPLSLDRYDFDQVLANRNEAYFSPSMEIVWKPDNRWNFSVSSGYGRAPISLSMVQQGYVMNDYRTIRRGVDNFYSMWGTNVGGSAKFRNVMHAFFAEARVSQNWSEAPFTMIQQLYGDYVVYAYAPAKSRSKRVSADGSMSKSLNFMHGIIKLYGGWQRSDSEIISQGKPVGYATESWYVQGRISSAPARWISAEYGCYYGAVNMIMNGNGAGWNGRVQNDLRLTLKPVRKWEWEVSGCHVGSQLADNKYSNTCMLSTELRYSHSRQVEVAASLNNVLNLHSFYSRSYTQLAMYESQRWMRGREFLISIYLTK